jgi:hypothetical protein
MTKLAMTSEPKTSKKSVFHKTAIKNLEQSLASIYGIEKALAINERASSILTEERNTMDDRGNKAIRKHLNNFILPGYSCYKALQESGITPKDAYDFVSKELNKTAKPTGDFMGKFKNFPFAYGLIRLLIKPIMKHGFPKEGWKIIWKESSGKRVAFDMTSCLYCEELKKRNAFELCPAYCESDHVAYDPLSPKILFKRTGKIALGSNVCDFCFEKG